MNTSSIIIRNLNVHAGHQQILKKINLAIPENRITVMLGPSGCGKTTLLKCMNRLTDLYKELKVEGEIFIGKDDILNNDIDLPVLRQKMGLLSQKPYLLPFSIRRNIAYGLKLKGISNKRQIASEVENTLQEVGLWGEVKGRLNGSANTLSIGQQQRLCLARGLAVRPAIILADEPTSALDPKSSRIIEDLLRKLKKDHTIILVTHILRQAKRLADHVVFMHNGEIVEQGEPEKLFSNPASQELKDYLIDGN